MNEDGTHATHRSEDDELVWDDIIESNTVRRLTYLSDKVIAVQGLAEAMQRAPEKDEYHHGMWTSDMPQQLFWVGQETRRPKELENIPSWSWASTDGRCSALSRRLLTSWEALQTSLAVENGRELIISCRSRSCVVRKWKVFNHRATEEPPLSKASVPGSTMWDLPIHFTNKMVHLMLDESTEEVVGLVMLDDVEAAGESVQHCVSAFILKEIRSSRQTQDHALVYFSLVLVRVSPSLGTYRRLGVGFVVDNGWVQGGTERNLRIL
jgi:hypothetical protein